MIGHAEGEAKEVDPRPNLEIDEMMESKLSGQKIQECRIPRYDWVASILDGKRGVVFDLRSEGPSYYLQLLEGPSCLPLVMSGSISGFISGSASRGRIGAW